MDRLGEAKGVLQLCSLLGRRFDYRLLRSVSRTENEEALKLDLQRIVNAEFLYQEGAIPESVYRFKHVLMQETARNSLLNSTRIELHAHVAEVIEAEFPEYAERNPALLGYHYAEGGQPVKAVNYLTVACKRSLEVFAMREAVDQAQRGLDTLARLPQTKDRDATEILLLSMLGKGLLALHGYADARVEENFTRALELSESLEESPEIFQILVGLWMYFFIGGESDDALMVAQRLVKLADADNSPAKSLQAYYCAGYSRYRMAEYEAGRRDIEHALTFASEDGDFSVVSASGDDTRVHAHCVIAHVLWHLGKEDLAQQHLADSIAMAAEEDNPWGSAYVSFIAAWHCMLRRDHVEAAEYAARTIAIAEEKSFRFWLLVGTFIRVWSSCEAGQSGSEEARAERLQKMEVTLESFLSSGAVFGSTSLGLQIAEDLASAGELDRAETWLNRVKSIVETTGERNYDADVPRIQGRIAAARGDTAKAVTLYEAAEKSATDKGSRALARRAASDKASLSDQLKTVQEVND
jgi:tetratricopeptide (TPR) repeat protein